MKPMKKRFTLRLTAAAIVAAGAVGGSALVITSDVFAQNRSDSNDRRDRNNSGNGGGDRQRWDRGDRPGGGFDRSRRFSGETSGSSNTAAPSQSPSSSSSTQQPAQERMSFKPSDYTTKYELLEQKNIFIKARRAWVPPDKRNVNDTSTPRKPEDSLVLRGIALQEGRRVAFVENTSNSTTARLTPGSSILSGKIVNVGGDYIEYLADGGQVTRIEIGRNFAGAVATAGSSSPSGSSSTTASGMTVTGTSSAASGASSAAPDPNNPNLSVEERMRLRRVQEQQKKQ